MIHINFENSELDYIILPNNPNIIIEGEWVKNGEIKITIEESESSFHSSFRIRTQNNTSFLRANFMMLEESTNEATLTMYNNSGNQLFCIHMEDGDSKDQGAGDLINKLKGFFHTDVYGLEKILSFS